MVSSLGDLDALRVNDITDTFRILNQVISIIVWQLYYYYITVSSKQIAKTSSMIGR